MSIVSFGITYFPDPTVGRPVFNGFIYVGEVGTDPTVVTNQKTILLRQESGLEIPTSQPVRTSAGGVPVYLGSPVQIIAEGDYALTVQNKEGAQVYYVPSGLSLASGGINYILVVENSTLASGQVDVTFIGNLGNATIFVGGESGTDRGRLILNVDYTVNTTTNTVTLLDSYPAGTIVSATYNDTGTTSNGLIAPYDTLADLRDASQSGINPVSYMKGRATPGDGAEGTFVWYSSDLSAEVTADPLSGIYVAPTSDLTGASGAWGRQGYFLNSVMFNMTGTPESVVTAPVGKMFLRTDGSAGTTLYIKESGVGNTGWVAK